jgi:hypothetical protein
MKKKGRGPSRARGKKERRVEEEEEEMDVATKGDPHTQINKSTQTN